MQATDPQGVRLVLKNIGVVLDPEQPHISGERFLQSPHKLVLLGKWKGTRVVVKASNHPEGKREIQQEKTARDTLKKLAFASDVLLMPEELYAGEQEGYTLFITAYIPQEKSLMSLPVSEQFFSMLRAFEAQEAFHATTWEHDRMIGGVFHALHAKDYVEAFDDYVRAVQQHYPNAELLHDLAHAQDFLREHSTDIERYCGHLTHSDFAPHNFRASARQLYVLDYTAIHFGNKYEGWARFLNFMLIHNPELERMLDEYVKVERGEGEYLDLRPMRVYKNSLLL